MPAQLTHDVTPGQKVSSSVLAAETVTVAALDPLLA